MLGTYLELIGAPFVYHGELFALVSDSPGVAPIARRWRSFGFRYFLGLCKRQRRWRAEIYEVAGLSVERTAQTLVALPGTQVVKVFWDHLDHDRLTDLLALTRPTVVVLRRDHEDRLRPLAKSKATGHWQNLPSVEVDVALDPDDVAKVGAAADRWFAEVHGQAESLGLRVIDVDFEDLVNHDGLAALAGAIAGSDLHEEAVRAARPATVRQEALSRADD